ncbi:MAG: hypothetical protein US81_C0025G0004 [Parcubacteria group bacterium GW2011_GWE2_38_18]|nr:MAG: hypothetical protein US81_C0025G0004 [Parcubacteria group bacterium GW2011_GWE2_38_18]
MKNARLLILLAPLVILALLELYLYKPSYIYLVLALGNLLIVFTLWRATSLSEINKEWWNFSILPVAFFSSVIAYSTILRQPFIVHSWFFIAAVLIFYYLKFCYYYLLKPFLYKVSSIENFSSYLNFLSFFLVASTLYGMQSFLDMPTLPLVFALICTSGLLIYQIIWANNFKIKNSLAYLIVGSLSVAELGWTISYLPINNNVSGLTLAILYYMLVDLIRFELSGKLDRTKIKLLIAFGLASVIIILLTARWL